MEIKCFCCGQLCSECKGGPTPEEVGQCERWDSEVLDIRDGSGHNTNCHAAVLCWICFWNLDPDSRYPMWVDKSTYEFKNPIVPFKDLPLLDHDNLRCWESEFYSWPPDEPKQLCFDWYK